MKDISQLFSDKSALYAAARPQYPLELFQYISSLCEDRNLAWDCASGNGQAAVGLSEFFSHVEATDISKEQIANAFQNQKVHYSVQPSEKSEFANHSFDLVNVAQALHWFDLDLFWTEVQRVLKPNGVFGTYTYSWSAVDNKIDEAVVKYIRNPIDPFWAKNNQLCWDGYAQIEFPFEKLATPKIDLINHWDFQEYMIYLHTWSATRRAIDSLEVDFFQTAEKEIASLWGDVNNKKAVTSPLTIIAGTAW